MLLIHMHSLHHRSAMVTAISSRASWQATPPKEDPVLRLHQHMPRDTRSKGHHRTWAVPLLELRLKQHIRRNSHRMLNQARQSMVSRASPDLTPTCLTSSLRLWVSRRACCGFSSAKDPSGAARSWRSSYTSVEQRQSVFGLTRLPSTRYTTTGQWNSLGSRGCWKRTC